MNYIYVLHIFYISIRYMNNNNQLEIKVKSYISIIKFVINSIYQKKLYFEEDLSYYHRKKVLQHTISVCY